MILVRSLLGLANGRGNVLHHAKNLGMAHGEEGITEHNLLLLKLHLDKQVRVQAFTHTQEVLNGADWEWWIGNSGSWYGMRVQAKRVYYPKEHFPKLYSYKANSAPDTQINTLISKSKTDGIDPVYCIYVADPAARDAGCQIASAHSVKAINSIKLADLAKAFEPWQNLVCYHSDTHTPMPPAARASRCIASTMDFGDERLDLPRPTEPRAKLPPYLEELRQTGTGDGLETLALEKDLQGFMVIDLGEDQ